MIDYTVAYRMDGGAFFAEVIGFPEASAFGVSLAGARENVLSALRLAAEQALRRGAVLPLPDAHSAVADAYLIERVRLMPDGDGRVRAAAVPA